MHFKLYMSPKSHFLVHPGPITVMDATLDWTQMVVLLATSIGGSATACKHCYSDCEWHYTW